MCSCIFNFINMERYHAIYYVKNRFQNLSREFDDFSLRMVSILSIACAVAFFALPIIFALPLVIIYDYLNHTYVYPDEFKRGANDLSWMFLRVEAEKVVDSRWDIHLDQEDLRECTIGEIELLKKINKNLQQQKEERAADNRPIFLVVTAKSDHNGTLNLMQKDGAIIINGDNSLGAKYLSNKYQIVVIDHIDSIETLKEELKKIYKQIGMLWIMGHGTPDHIYLKDRKKIDGNNLGSIAEVLQEKLSLNADVVLYSCSTGMPLVGKENIAQRFARVLPGRVVWAPKIPTGLMTMCLDSNFSAQVDFWNWKTRWEFIIQYLRNVITCAPNQSIQKAVNVTARYRY